MAMSVGKAPGHRLRGLDRLMATAADLVAPPALKRAPAAKVPSRWLIERGSTRATATVDLVGGFPGSIRAANRLTRAALVVADRYLVVGEGTTTGFAIPITDLIGAGLVRSAAQPAPGLVIRYRDVDAVRTFGVEIRGVARTFGGAWRAEEVLRALAARNVPILDERRIAGPVRLAMSWDAARARAEEPLRWSGTASAAVGGWFGARRSGCRVWLTDGSLFWCCPQGQGVNRLALEDIADVRVGPFNTVLVATTDGLGHRFEVPFTFDGKSARAAFVEALREGGSAIVQAVPPMVPWLRGNAPRR